MRSLGKNQIQKNLPLFLHDVPISDILKKLLDLSLES